MVAAAIAGDRDALSALWRRHRRWVAAVLLTYKPADADLEDLLQDTAMRLVAKIDTLREHRNVRAWLRAVAVNVARSAGRRSKIGRVTPLIEAQCPEIHTDTEDADSAADLLRWVAELPETYREPLLLRAVRGMRTRQIAEILDLPPATIDTRIARARRMVRERAEDESACGARDHDDRDWSAP